MVEEDRRSRERGWIEVDDEGGVNEGEKWAISAEVQIIQIIRIKECMIWTVQIAIEKSVCTITLNGPFFAFFHVSFAVYLEPATLLAQSSFLNRAAVYSH